MITLVTGTVNYHVIVMITVTNYYYSNNITDGSNVASCLLTIRRVSHRKLIKHVTDVIIIQFKYFNATISSKHVWNYL